MKEGPILFSGAMVCAIIDELKTNTRRVINPQPTEYDVSGGVRFYKPTEIDRRGCEYPGAEVFGFATEERGWPCPYGQPGDRLWVRETWRECDDDELGTCIEYRADGARIKPDFPTESDGWKTEQNSITLDSNKWRPSIFMPRAYSRITLEITSILIERVQDISVNDALSEGVHIMPDAEAMKKWGCRHDPRKAFADLWDSINLRRGFGWDVNPFVWVIAFKRLENDQCTI